MCRSSFVRGLKFRFNSVDAPETGDVGAATGGFKSEFEIELRFKS